MPEIGQDVIGSNENDGWVCSIYFTGKKWHNSFDTNGDDEVFPTHWKELPNPPKTK